MNEAAKLQTGDVFQIKPGMKIQARIPEMFVYSNRLKSTALTDHVFAVGDVLDNEGKKKLKTTAYVGEYVVTNTTFDGGSTGHDPYPNGHHVFAQRLAADGSYDSEAELINFYQSGCFSHCNDPKETPVIRTLVKKVDFV